MVDKLPKNRKQLNASYRFSGDNIDKVNFDKRRIINLLPGVHQTETLQKFFAASADHLFEPGSSKPLNGYIGRSVSYRGDDATFYLDEPTLERQAYQLEPSMVSLDQNGDTKALLFYDDLINNLRFQGGLVNNHQRLFEQAYFSWCPSIDLDKFLNFSEYYWVPEGPTPIEIRGHSARYIGDGNTNTFALTNAYPLPVVAAQVSVTVDGTEVPFNMAGSDQVSILPPPARDSVVHVYTAIDFIAEVEGKQTFEFINGTKLESNMRVVIKNDKELSTKGKIFIVEGVGEQIVLIQDNNPDLTLKKDFFVIARGSSDGNPWSTGNRWFHRSLLGDFTKVNLKSAQAKRPIIEFARNIQLFNFGSHKREAVDLVSHSIDHFLAAVNGQTVSTRRVDGVSLDKAWIDANGTNGAIRVLVVNDLDPRITNRVYRVTAAADGKMRVTLSADGLDISGAPVFGEAMDVRFGTSMGSMNVHWDGMVWKTSQKKFGANQFPLFYLYDGNGVAFDDAETYPNSDFAGSRVFGYAVDETMSVPQDTVLGIRPQRDTKGEFIFENYLATFKGQYKIGVDFFDLPNKCFYKIIDSNGERLVNDWHEVTGNSRQMVIDKFKAENGEHLFTASQEPIEPYADNLIVSRNGKTLDQGVDYIRRFNQVLLVEVEDGDDVEVRTFNPANKPMNTPGQYEIPLNLEANPAWEQITLATRGDLFEQFIQIIKSQKGFVGIEYSTNNYKDIAHDLSAGRHIVSNSAPLLRTMLMSSIKDIDFIKAASYAQDEYARFRGKFDQKIQEFMISNRLGTNATPTDWVDNAINEISKGFTNDFPFYSSRMAQAASRNGHTFIPPTPSFLGVFPIQEPTVYVEPVTGRRFIIGHDGSSFPFYGDIRDAVTLELEQRIYESAPDFIRERAEGFFDFKGLVSTAFFESPYSKSELDVILRPMFEKWAVNNGVDYRINDSFDANDPFTWNWSSCSDKDGRQLAGHWRGIYNFYYGTDRPHTHPWEMLGFEYQPDWWTPHYGPAPYGSGNVILWRDIEAGRIVDGPRMGIDERFARPGLNKFLPVDQQGNLLDPLQAKITNTSPRSMKAADEWKWGDGAPAEAAWKSSFWYPFAMAQACYLMRPPSFIETTWDITRNQDINANMGYGYPYADEIVHGEMQFDGSIAYKHGTQQWVVDYLISKNKDVKENLGDLIRGLGVKLAYKVGGFTQQESLFVVSDNIDRIPPEDVAVELYKSPSIREESLSGIIVQKIENGWKVFGYDILDPVFKIITSDPNGPSNSVSVGKGSRPTIPTWKANTYYGTNTTVRYIDSYYRAIKSHTSSRNFEPQYWLTVARPAYADAAAVAYYTSPKDERVVERVPYGSTIKSPQEMSNLISAYERYLVSRGWLFDTIALDETTVHNWQLSLKDFLNWAQDENTKDGDIISLIPNNTEIRFQTQHGNVEPIEQIVNGVYSILDKVGNPIRSYNTNIVRDGGTVTIQTVSNQQMYSVRLHVSEIEHTIVINNQTIFGDIVYSPLFNIRQPRLRLQGFKTKNWQGRVDAPGFIVNGNKLTVNFEKAADDFRRLFDIESIEDSKLKDRARANIGYQEKEYLNNLLMTPTNQFEFYQGAIQQKGTIAALQKLFRSNFIRHNDGFNVLEEWGFRLGMFGAQEINPSMDFLIRQGDFKASPQLFQFNGTGQGGWDLRLAWDDDHWDYLKDIETVKTSYNINGLLKVQMTNRGIGYTEVPRAYIPDDATGTQFSPILDWTNSGIKEVQIIRGGEGFVVGDQIELEGTGSGAGLFVKQVDYQQSRLKSVFVTPVPGVVGAGTGYSVGQVIGVVGGNGNGRATISKVSETGAILELTVTSAGAGYSETPIGFSFPPGNISANGRLSISVTGGRLMAVEIVYPGKGYEPTVSPRFTNNGKNAQLQINVTGGDISGVQVLNGGSGFTSSPEIVFEGGGTPSVPATAIGVVRGANESNVVTLAKFKATHGIILKSFTINVTNEFNGVQPILTIGDAASPARYVSEINLADRSSRTIVLDDGQQVTNESLEVQAFIENAQASGNVDILFTFEYTPNYYNALFTVEEDDNAVKVYDLFNNDTGEFMYKNDRWVWRHQTKNPDWPLIQVNEKDKGNLPSAGYVHLDDVKWTATNMNAFLNLYRNLQNNNPFTPIVNEVTITYKDGETATRRVNLVPNLSKGTYRVKNFVVDVLDAFPVTSAGDEEVMISIGTVSEPEKFMPVTAVQTDRIQNYTHQVYEYLESKQNDENAIYVFVSQKSGLQVSPGKLTVTANIELIGDIAMPGDRVWTYNTGFGDWDVFRLGDTTANVLKTRPQSFETQGTVISTSRNMFDALGIEHNFQEPKPSQIDLNPTFQTDIDNAEERMKLTILDGILPDNNTTNMLMGTYKAKFQNSVKIFVDAGAMIRTNGKSLVQIPIMDLWADSGIVINKITASVVRPFGYPAGNNPTITIGTLTDRTRFTGAVNSPDAYRYVMREPSRPSFSYADPITVSVYDTSMTLSEQDEKAKFRLIRNGNIFATPSNIKVTNPGWGYAENSFPKVTVLGPVGVKATAHIEGTIVGYAVTNGGTGYTSAPTITVIGGGGTGAKGIAVLTGDKLTDVTVPGAGTGTTASATLQGNKVDSISITTGGSGWEMTPIVTLEGGNPSAHAAVTATMSGGAITGIDVDFGGEAYAGVPTVKFHPTTGAGYKFAPRVVVSGGGGSGAQVEPIMLWRVTSITIDDWGKCSWTGQNGSVTVETPNGGAPAQAELIATPAVLEDTEIAQWRYRLIEPSDAPNLNEWTYVSDPVVFPAPDGNNNPDYWVQTIELDVPEVEERTSIEIEIPEFVIDAATGAPTSTPNVTNGTVSATNKGLLTVHNTIAGSRDIDLKVAGTVPSFYLNDRINDDNKMVAFYNSDGVSEGLLTLVIDYHYTSGFELYDLNDNAVTTGITGAGGDILAWNSVHFANNTEPMLPENLPVDGWKTGDLVLLDDGRNDAERAKVWTTTDEYEYHDLVSYDGNVYRSIQGGRGLVADMPIQDNDQKSLDRPKITNYGTLYTREPIVTITGDGQDGAAHALLGPTSVYRIKVNNPDTNYGYTGDERITITPRYTSGRGAEARITSIVAGSIKEITVIAPGWGYDSAPIVKIENDSASVPVELECVMKPARIKAIQMDNRGSGYTTATISFTEVGPTVGTFVRAEWEPANEAVSGWGVHEASELNGEIHWDEIRRETPKIDSSMIDSAVIYDTNTSETLQTLQLYDPYKGYIPSAAKKEIAYMLEYDPAIYSNGPLTRSSNSNEKLWGANQVGEIWWDISTTRYLDYEIGETEYKWRNWGKLCPGIQVNIYEWTRSTVAPNMWANEVEKKRNDTSGTKPTGTVKGILGNPSWVELVEFNKELNRNETVYYFWVKHSSTVPHREDRSLTARQIAAIIQDPNASDVPWFAVIDTNKIIVGGAKQYVNDYSTSLKIKWKTSKNEGADHKEWKLINEGDERNNIDERIWNKMRDSLVGWDASAERKTFTAIATTMIDPNVDHFSVADASGFLPSGEVRVGDYWVQYKYLFNNTFFGISGLGSLRYATGTKVTQTREIQTSRKVPNQWLNEHERYGSLIRPSQTWFKVDTDGFGFLIPGRDARQTFVDTLNQIFAREPVLDTRYEWREIFESHDPEPSSIEYVREVFDEFELSQLGETGVVEPGQMVLMHGTPDTNGLWTLWLYSPGNPAANASGFVLWKAERWRLREGELWTAVDWYADGWSTNDYPIKHYANRQARDADTTLVISPGGTLVQVDTQSETDTRWSWYLRTEDGWLEVAKEKATIRLADNFYAPGMMVYGFDDYKVGSSKKRDGSWELQWIINSLRTKLLTGLERNELFFSMVKVAVSQHPYTDWIFKTSFLYLAGYNEQLTQSPIVFKDQVDNIMSYIEDIKPYHVKVRDFVRRLTPPIENLNLVITDFDKPMYYDELANNGEGAWRKLDPENANDQLIMKNDPQLKWWYENYKKTNYSLENWDANWNPVRRPKITMLFDRVSCEPLAGWSQPEMPWDGNEERWVGNNYTRTFAALSDQYRIPNQEYKQHLVETVVLRDQIARDSQTQVNLGNPPTLRTGDIAIVKSERTTFMWTGAKWEQFYNVFWDLNWAGGLADRIDQFYEPSATMRRKELTTLIRGCDFRGTVVDGRTFEQGIWDMFAWDMAEWDGEFEAYVGRDTDINPAQSQWQVSDSAPYLTEATDDIRLEGGELVQPWFEGGHPDELVRLRVRNPMMITVYRKPTSQGDMISTRPTAYRFFKDSLNNWEGVFLQDHGIKLAQVLAPTDREMQITVAGTLPLFDPANNDPAYIASIREKIALSIDVDLSKNITAKQAKKNPIFGLIGLADEIKALPDATIVNTIIEDRLTLVLMNNITGVVWLGAERITYSGITDNGGGSYTLTGLARGTGGSSRNEETQLNMDVFDGSTLNALQSWNTTDFRVHSVQDYSKNWKAWWKASNDSNVKPGPSA